MLPRLTENSLARRTRALSTSTLGARSTAAASRRRRRRLGVFLVAAIRASARTAGAFRAVSGASVVVERGGRRNGESRTQSREDEGPEEDGK